MKRSMIAAAVAAAVSISAAAWAQTPDYVTVAISDSSRPATDVARDAARKPADMVTFAGLKPGQTVLEITPGGGYFTRIFSKVIGPSGHLYAAVPDPKSQFAEPAPAAIAAEPGYSNISVVTLGTDQMKTVPPVDLIWTSWNYHDLHLTAVHANMAVLDKQWFDLLKPGGVVVIVDHVALPGSPATATADKLHRIDPAVVKSEMAAVGFQFDGESDVLRNPDDPHTAIVFDPSIRGKTDQFAYRFKKPM